MSHESNTSLSISSIPTDQGDVTVYGDDTSSWNNDIANRKTAKDVNSKRMLKGLMTNDDSINVPNYYALLDIVGILIGCLVTSILTLIPQENAYQKPSHWYEYPLLASIGYGLGNTIKVLSLIHISEPTRPY